MKLCILLCLLTLAVSENLHKLEHKGKKTPLLWYILERLTSLSTNVNEIKNKQAQIGTELANWKTIVDNQFSSLKKQSKCQSDINGLLSFNPSPKWPFEKYIRFDAPFTATPSFVYGLSVLDFAHTKNVRAVANIRSLTRTGVVLYLNKWTDTVMYGLKISWMACPK